jgi:hypothetical protein
MTEDLLDALSEILREHRGPAAGALRVVPILADGVIEESGPLLDAVARHAEGALIDSTDPDVQEGLFGVEDLLLAADIEGLIVPAPGGDTYSVRVGSGPSGRVSVEFEGRDRASLNAGHRSLLDLLTALFHARLRDRSLAILMYEETHFDWSLLSVAWSVVSEHIARLALGDLRTLVVVVDSPTTHYGLHCYGSVSARYIQLQNGQLAKRKEQATAVSTARHAVATSPDGFCVFFLAAGFSASSRPLPLGNALRDEAIRTLLQEPSIPDGEVALRFWRYLEQQRSLQAAEQAEGFDAFAQRLTLERVLAVERSLEGRVDSSTIRYFADLNAQALAAPGPAVLELARILGTGRPAVLVTVNFDELVETHCGPRIQPIVTDGDFAQVTRDLPGSLAANGPVPLLKLHGTIGQPDSLVATLDTTRYGLSEARRGALRSLRDLAPDGTPWFYVGSSMRDVDVEAEIADRDYALRFREFWVAPVIDASVGRFVRDHRDEVWAQNGKSPAWDRSVTLTGDEFFSSLV